MNKHVRMLAAFHHLYLTDSYVCSLVGSPENRFGYFTCQEDCKEAADDHVQACTALRVSCKFSKNNHQLSFFIIIIRE